MQTHRLVATVGVVVLALTTAACHSKSTSSAAPTTSASSAASSTSPAAAPASAAPASAAPASAAPASAAASSAAPSSAAASSAASAPAAAAGSGSVTFDGSYSGKLTDIVCIGSGPTTTASFHAAFTGQGALPGDISANEFGFQGPADTDFDSGFLTKALDTDGKGFDVDGIVAKDEGGKSVTMHGTLVCP
jgi:predicted flap endonuclease-1-like 5' DNA nuclease